MRGGFAYLMLIPRAHKTIGVKIERVTRPSAEPGEIRRVLLYLERSKTRAFIECPGPGAKSAQIKYRFMILPAPRAP